jgi:hypothetical protein
MPGLARPSSQLPIWAEPRLSGFACRTVSIRHVVHSGFACAEDDLVIFGIWCAAYQVAMPCPRIIPYSF